MTDVFGGPFGAYGAITGMTSGAKTTVLASIDSLVALIPDDTLRDGIVSNATPDFDQIPPHTANKLRAELASLRTTVTAATT